MKRLAVIVPISPFESEDIVLKSVEHLKSLDYNDFEVRIVYVVDKNLRIAEILKKHNVKVLFRENSKGKRAGAINHALKYLKKFKPDYIAIFDVDSRPEKNFIIECVNALENCENCYIASSKRYINNGINIVSETIEAEYRLINFLLSKSGFKQFNGLIGVLKGDILMKEMLNENAITEDADFATRMHIKGYRAKFVKTTKIYEQAPITWKDLYDQRKRWYFGGLQLWKYWRLVRNSEKKFRISWLLSLTLTYITSVFTPLLILAPFIILSYYKSLRKFKVFLGLTIHVFLLQIAAIDALTSFITKRSVEWKKIKRIVK